MHIYKLLPALLSAFLLFSAPSAADVFSNPPEVITKLQRASVVVKISAILSEDAPIVTQVLKENTKTDPRTFVLVEFEDGSLLLMALDANGKSIPESQLVLPPGSYEGLVENIPEFKKMKEIKKGVGA